jgi:hypothetical protein
MVRAVVNGVACSDGRIVVRMPLSPGRRASATPLFVYLYSIASTSISLAALS